MSNLVDFDHARLFLVLAHPGYPGLKGHKTVVVIVAAVVWSLPMQEITTKPVTYLLCITVFSILQQCLRDLFLCLLFCEISLFYCNAVHAAYKTCLYFALLKCDSELQLITLIYLAELFCTDYSLNSWLALLALGCIIIYITVNHC